ncbi:MAG TPA: D-TA family PLP-dependent enzyme [Chryseolinea sp.]|nr:D-TA family PLP-dependent enzyme [Chryseolinea sp.]
MNKEWYVVDNVAELDSPALLIYLDRVASNIETLTGSINDVGRLRPHVKTHKSLEVCKLMLKAGIRKFKCATIAEAEMLAMAGAPDVLLAYQPVGPKANRLLSVGQQFPSTRFSCLIDNVPAAKALSDLFNSYNLLVAVFIDLNVGMNRTGIAPPDAFSLYEKVHSFNGIDVVGLHAYDGHIRDSDLSVRKNRCDEVFNLVVELQQQIKNKFNTALTIVIGGTPSYSVHSTRSTGECSPGTFIYWDKGYADILKEQQFSFAALVVSRVISKPSADIICVDLGHKSIASENPLTQRVYFLNGPNLTPIGHSEEHMVFKVAEGKSYEVGDVLYGVPFHICPTVALHERAAVVENNQLTGYWNNVSRNRKITI